MMNYAPKTLITHPLFLSDDLPEESVERTGRLEILLEDVPSIQQLLEQEEVLEGEIHLVRAANGEVYLPLFHNPGYIDEVREMCASLRDREYAQINDTCLNKDSYTLACYAVGATIQAARLAKEGKKSFAVVRPPGHHAYADKGDGFCIFNNVAIATEYLRRRGEKVLIVDVDLHVGDGTLSYVEGKEKVFYYSMGQEELWPHIDASEERENVKLEFLPEGITDDLYISALEKTLMPVLRDFKPDIIAVSAGFDTFATDYVDYRDTFKGGFCLSPRVYKSLWKMLDESLIPYFAVLEGGYNPVSVCTGVLSFFEKEK